VQTQNLVKSLSLEIPSQNNKINGLISGKLAHFCPGFTMSAGHFTSVFTMLTFLLHGAQSSFRS